MDSETDGFQYVRFLPLPLATDTCDSGNRSGSSSSDTAKELAAKKIGTKLEAELIFSYATMASSIFKGCLENSNNWA